VLIAWMCMVCGVWMCADVALINVFSWMCLLYIGGGACIWFDTVAVGSHALYVKLLFMLFHLLGR